MKSIHARPPLASMLVLVLVPVLVPVPAVAASAQHGQAVAKRPAPGPTIPLPQPPATTWFSGDTHEHFQSCDNLVHPLSEILAQMEDEDLNLANILVWNTAGQPYGNFACQITGVSDPLSTPERILQLAIETSGLDCGKWGHLSGLGVGPEQALFVRTSLARGDCVDAGGLGLGCADGDGSGVLNSAVAEHFLRGPGVVCGYAHTYWANGLYDPSGFDWQARLVASGFTQDAVYLDPEQLLAVPNLERLLSDDPVDSSLHGDLLRAFFPLLGPVDAVLGAVQFFETTALLPAFPLPFNPPSNWYSLYYKLLSAGLRVGISAGSDRACPLPGVTEWARTNVWLDEPFSYPAWARGIAQGRVTLGTPSVRLDLHLAGRRVGEELDLSTGHPGARAAVEIESATPLDDAVELVVNSEVRAAQGVVLLHPGMTRISFDDLNFSASSWVAVRLASQRAHTAAIYVVVDGRPVADPLNAEYLMLWCDIVTQATLEHPELALFGCQEDEALARIERARRAFKSYRDLAGFDPSWRVARYGLSTPACRGPIAIGTSGPLTGPRPTIVTCMNAPPEASGFLLLSRRADPDAPCIDGARILVGSRPGDLVGVFPVASSRSGYAEVELPPILFDASPVYGQFLWNNPEDCGGPGCRGSAERSASDALQWEIRGPIVGQ